MSWCVKECVFVEVVGFIVQYCPQNGKHVQSLVMCLHVYVVDTPVSIHVYMYTNTYEKFYIHLYELAQSTLKKCVIKREREREKERAVERDDHTQSHTHTFTYAHLHTHLPTH